MTIWCTSDTHYGHAKIIEYCDRPFKTADEMDEMLVAAWNERVRPGDNVYHMGDVSFHRNAEVTRRILGSLNGQKFLIKGNHDRKKMLRTWGDQFVWVKDYHELEIEGQLIVMSHFPFLTWHKAHRGSWNLHGHCHGNLPDDPVSRRMDVGVDCFGYAPVSLESIAALMKKKTFEPIDHHREL